MGSDAIMGGDDWAEVELWRWQYGRLPDKGDEDKKLNVPEALRGMLKRVASGEMQPPTFFNMEQALSAVARWWEAGVTENEQLRSRVAELEAEHQPASGGAE